MINTNFLLSIISRRQFYFLRRNKLAYSLVLSMYANLASSPVFPHAPSKFSYVYAGLLFPSKVYALTFLSCEGSICVPSWYWKKVGSQCSSARWRGQDKAENLTSLNVVIIIGVLERFAPLARDQNSWYNAPFSREIACPPVNLTLVSL